VTVTAMSVIVPGFRAELMEDLIKQV